MINPTKNSFAFDINTIVEGNIEYLKKIPKIEFTEEITTLLMTLLEDKIEEIDNIINANTDSVDAKYILINSIEKRQKVEKCMLYLKKIK
jgi:tetrahydromethanopterin S-methyltransferase subunit B